MLLCHFCGNLLSNAYTLQRHVSTFHGSYACDTCGKTFGDLSVYYNHLHSCKSLCKYCDLELTNINERNEHMSTQHQDKKFQCTKCKKKFTAKRNLNVQQRCCIQLRYLLFSRGQCSIVINPQSNKSMWSLLDRK